MLASIDSESAGLISACLLAAMSNSLLRDIQHCSQSYCTPHLFLAHYCMRTDQSTNQGEADLQSKCGRTATAGESIAKSDTLHTIRSHPVCGPSGVARQNKLPLVHSRVGQGRTYDWSPDVRPHSMICDKPHNVIIISIHRHATVMCTHTTLHEIFATVWQKYGQRSKVKVDVYIHGVAGTSGSVPGVEQWQRSTDAIRQLVDAGQI